MEDRNSNLKSSLGRFLRNAWDLFILQMLWLVCSLPIITMGPATSALFSVTLKIARDEPVSTAKEFFAALKTNFKQALVLGLIALAGAFIAYTDFNYAIALEGNQKNAFLIVTGIVIAVWLIFTSFSFPLVARYDNSLKNHIKNTFLAAFCAPGKTITMWAVYAFPVLLFIVAYDVALYIGWIYVIYGISLPVYINSKTLRTIFDKMSGGTQNDQNGSKEAG